MDPAEAHAVGLTVTGQAYTPPLVRQEFVEPDSAQAVDTGPSAALVEPERLPDDVPLGVLPAANHAARSFRGVLDALTQLAADVSGLLDVLDDLVDDDGREIWLRAGEVELDQFVAHVIEERDAVRRSLRGAADPT